MSGSLEWDLSLDFLVMPLLGEDNVHAVVTTADLRTRNSN